MFGSTIGKAAKNTSWLMVERIVKLFVGFFSGILIARLLGVEDFGRMSFVVSCAFLIEPLVKCGLHSIITRDLCVYQDKISVLKGVFVIRAISSILSVAVALAALFLSDVIEQPLQLLVAIVMLSLLFSPFEVSNYWFESEVKIKPVVIARTAIFLFSAIFKVAAVYFFQSLTLLILLIALDNALTYVAPYFLYNQPKRNNKPFLPEPWNKQYSLALFKESWWLVFSGLAAAIYMKVDQVMLGTMSGQVDVGVYAVAVRLSEVAYFLPVAIATSLFPAIMKTKGESVNKYQMMIKRVLGGLFWMAVFGAVMCTLIAQPLIRLLYGEEYIASADVLKVHIWASIFVFMRALVSKWILAESLAKYSLLTQGAGAVVNVFLNWLWIPKYGPMGAAYATLVSVFVASWFMIFLPARTRQMSLWMLQGPLLFASFVVGRIKSGLV